MPIGLDRRRASPGDIAPRESLQNVGVGGDVRRIVIVDESTIEGREVQKQRPREQNQRKHNWRAHQTGEGSNLCGIGSRLGSGHCARLWTSYLGGPRLENMAERVGFEPTIPVKVCPLSRRIVSTTHAPLRKQQSALSY